MTYWLPSIFMFFILGVLPLGVSGEGWLYVTPPGSFGYILNGQAMACTSSCAGTGGTIVTECNYTFNPIGKSCTTAGYFTGHAIFTNLNTCITQEKQDDRATSTGEQNLAYCDICDSGCCIACDGNLQNVSCGSGYNKCETQCGAPAGTSLAGVAYSCDDKSVGAILSVCDVTGTTYFADKCGTTGNSCALADNTAFCRSSAYADGCTAYSLCNGLPTGSNVTSCVGGVDYFADKCSSSCAAETRDDNICRSSSFNTTCTALSYCNNLPVGSDITYCAGGLSYFGDKCSSSCGAEDKGDNICRSSSFDASCDAFSACNGLPAGTNLTACTYTGQTYLRDKCSNACSVTELNVCGSPFFGSGCTGSEACNGFAPSAAIPYCNHVGNSYFQDTCDGTCRGWENTSVCRSAGSIGSGDGCSADANCNNVAPNTCAGATKCNADCSYSTCDNGCCNSTKAPPYAEGYCSGGCRGNNLPTATNFKGGGTYLPKSNIKLNATLQDNDQVDEQVNLTFYQNSACSLTLTSGVCTPIVAGTCDVSAPLTLGSVPDAYVVYYKATDSRLTSPCTSTAQTITIHNFTLSFDYQDQPMLVNATGWTYLTATSQPERIIMNNTQIVSNSYTIKKGATTIKSGSLDWEPITKRWTANITPPDAGYYETLATFTDTFGLTNSIKAQITAADTLFVDIDSSSLIEIPIGQSALVHLNVQNTGNKARTYNLTFLGDIYATSFNGQDLSGRRWHTLMEVPASSNRTGLILVTGQEVSPNIKEFRVTVKNTQTNAESETKTVQYRTVYMVGSQKVAPDLDTLSLLFLLSSGILYLRFSSCKQKNSRK